MGLAIVAVVLACYGQTVGTEQLVGWSARACWWDCGDLGSDFGVSLGYHWPDWLVQISYVAPDGRWLHTSVDGEVWAVEGLRLWRGGHALSGRSWFAGVGLGFYDVGVDMRLSSGTVHDTSSEWAVVAAAGLRWPSGWFVMFAHTMGADASVSGPRGLSGTLDIDGPRIIVGRRF